MKQNNTMTVNRGEYLKIFIIFFILFAVWTKTNPMGGTDGSRMAQIQSLVEHGSFIIDKSRFSDTVDRYFFNGHFYSDKPPILALYASLFYFALRRLGLSFQDNAGLTYYLITLLSIGVLSALGLVVFRRILREFFRTSSEWADIATFITGVGTLILPYSLVFNNHVPSGVLILLGFYFLLGFGKNSGLKNAAYSGIFLSLAGAIDINCFLFIPFILITFFKKSAKAGMIFAMSCVPVIALYLSLNLYTSGSLMPPAMNSPLWNYPGSIFDNANLSGLAHHNSVLDALFYAFHVLLGNRGLISHTPILLFSIFGILIIYRKSRFEYKAEYTYILLATLLYIAIYILRTTNYSGWAFGVRWFASLMLILCLPLGCIESKVRSSRTIRVLFLVVTCLSILISIIGVYHPLSPLIGTELQERLSPTNTIFVNIQLMIDWFSKKAIATLVLGAFITYFLLYRFTKNLQVIHLGNQEQ